MKAEEAEELVLGAVDFIEGQESPKERLELRKKMAPWLHSKFKIAIRDVMVSAVDGKAYLHIEFLDDKNEVQESKVCVDHWQERFTNELKERAEKSDVQA